VLNVTKLLRAEETEREAESKKGAGLSPGLLRYAPSPAPAGRKPIVVWNLTRACNLHCLHCYTSSRAEPDPDELSTREALSVVDDLAALGIPVIIFSGGDPLLHPGLFEIAGRAADRGISISLSTNGTLIDETTVTAVKSAGFRYVGVSVDGAGPAVNDRLRGHPGAFAEAIRGIRLCRDAGLTVGLRFTLSKNNVHDLPGLFDLADRERIDRVYIAHLVYAGRGAKIAPRDLSAAETRKAMDLILARAESAAAEGRPVEIVTGSNDADGPYLHMAIARRDPALAARIHRLLLRRGGNSSGVAIANIDPQGNIHPDQFWTRRTYGNVRRGPFGRLWRNPEDPVLSGLRDRERLLKDRCGACRFRAICMGSYRVRAEVIHGDPWAPDPACYLTDDEIGITPAARELASTQPAVE
jgi:radical SAM protein with 4Fe4S-binding SPASM domain